MAAPNQYRYDTTAEQDPTNQWAYPEFNRRWAIGYDDKYLCPIDVIEKDRMDILHKIFTELRHGKQHKVPLTPVSRSIHPAARSADAPPTPTSSNTRKPAQTATGPNILDLGAGTGIWAIGMAKQWPQGSVLGMDLFWFLQPKSIMPNSHFWTMNVVEPWDGVDYNWDMVHTRMMVGHIADWQSLYHKAFDHLRPGTGWFEQVELDFTFRSHNDSIREASVFRQWEKCYRDGLARYGIKGYCDSDETIAMLQRAGFVDIEVEVIDVPMAPWDKRNESLGRSANLAITRGLHAMSLRPMINNGMTKNEVDDLVDHLGQELCRLSWETYIRLYIWTGRRPDDAKAPVSPSK